MVAGLLAPNENVLGVAVVVFAFVVFTAPNMLVVCCVLLAAADPKAIGAVVTFVLLLLPNWKAPVSRKKKRTHKFGIDGIDRNHMRTFHSI